MPVDGPLAHQNIRDRYYGQNDPVAQKMMGRARSSQGVLEPPADRTITTLWVGGVEPAMSESALRSKFAAHGEVAEVRVISDKVCFLFIASIGAALKVCAMPLASEMRFRDDEETWRMRNRSSCAV